MENIKALANEFKALGGMWALYEEDAPAQTFEQACDIFEALVDAIESLSDNQIVEAQQIVGNIVENFNY